MKRRQRETLEKMEKGAEIGAKKNFKASSMIKSEKQKMSHTGKFRSNKTVISKS
jgi:hypothetical protein